MDDANGFVFTISLLLVPSVMKIDDELAATVSITHSY